MSVVKTKYYSTAGFLRPPCQRELGKANSIRRGRLARELLLNPHICHTTCYVHPSLHQLHPNVSSSSSSRLPSRPSLSLSVPAPCGVLGVICLDCRKAPGLQCMLDLATEKYQQKETVYVSVVFML